MFEGINPVGDLWRIATDRLAGKVAAENSKDQFDTEARYGVDEFGRPYLRGQASSSIPAGVLGVSPIIVIGVGVLAVTLLVFALKR